MCCYPDHVALLGSAADHANELVVFSFPRADTIMRSINAVENGFLALTGAGYRGYVHPPTEMLATLERHGFTAEVLRRGLVWQVAVATTR